MKTRPIIFQPEMVRAILDGRKSQTRRVIKPQPYILTGTQPDEWPDEYPELCPCGVPGDRFWVREAHQFISPDERWRPIEECNIVYRATDEHPGFCARTYEEHMGYKETGKDICYPWRPSIHLSRKYSRLTLEITNVRVERVQDISYQDVFCEGIDRRNIRSFELFGDSEHRLLVVRRHFQVLWDKMHKKSGFGWSDNPWVWVVEFKKVAK